MKKFQKTGALALALLLAGGAVAPATVVQAAETQNTEVSLEQFKENALKELKKIGQDKAFDKQVKDAKTIDEVKKVLKEAEEKSKDPVGYETEEEATNAAKAKLDEKNKFYAVAQDKDGKWYFLVGPNEITKEQVLEGYLKKEDADAAAKKYIEDNKLEGKTYKVERGLNGRFIYSLNQEENEEKENNEVGYLTKEKAEAAAKEALKKDPINKDYSVDEKDGRYFYLLKILEEEKVVEENNEVGYLTRENAETAAKEALKSDLVNNEYEIAERDGKFFYELKIGEAKEEPKEENLDEIKAKAIEEIKGLKNLDKDESQRKKLIELVKDATTKEDVAKILEDAKKVKPGEVDVPVPETDLGQYKEKAIETIKALNLTGEKKNDYTVRVNKAKDKQEVDAIVAAAKKDAENTSVKETPKVDFTKLKKAVINGDKAHKSKRATVKQNEKLEKLLAKASLFVDGSIPTTQEKADELANEIDKLVDEINKNKVTVGEKEVQKTVNKTELSNLIVEADKIIKDLKKGTVEQRDKLTKLLNEGRQVRDNEKATQEEVNKAAKDLKAVIDEINGVKKDEKAAKNAKTGVTGIAAVAGVLATATASFVANKKRR